MVLDAVTADIQRGVFRPDLKNFPNSSATQITLPNSVTMPTFTFYTRAAGMSTGSGTVRPVSLVTYQLSKTLPGYLLRSENTIIWTGGSNFNFQQPFSTVPQASTAQAPPNDLLSTGIVDFKIIFLLSDGTTVLAEDYQSPTKASVVTIGVTVAVIDDKVLALLQPATTTQFSKIQQALETSLSLSPPHFPP